MMGRRRMRRGSSWIAVAFLVGLYSWALLGRAQTLDVPVVAQAEEKWCWAASSQAVMDYYYGYNIVSQCKIVEWARVAGGWGGEDDCCENGDSDVCNQTDNMCTGDESIRSILDNWAIASECVWDWLEQVPPLTPNQIEDEIQAGRPFVMRLADFNGHFVVGSGFQRDPNGQDHLVGYMDPWGEGGYNWDLYDDLARLVQPDPDDPKRVAYWNLSLQLSTDPWAVDQAVLAGDIGPDGATIKQVSGHVYGMVKGFDVNDAGTVIYIAKLEPDGEGIYTTAGEVVARSGHEAPGGGRFARFYMPGGFRSVAINNAGKAAFLAALEDDGQGIYTTTGLIARTGQATPEGGTFEQFYGADINNAAQVVFVARATKTDGTTRNGLYLADDDGIVLITTAGVIGGIPTLRDDGLAIYLGGYPDQAIADSTGRIFAQSGGDAPGGGTYAPGPMAFNYPDVAATGPVEPVFTAQLASGEEGVFTDQRRIAVSGEAAPGGGNFVNLPGRPAINAAGHAVYLGGTSDGRLALFDDQGNVRAARGESVFGGWVIEDLADPVLTDSGRVAFYARVSKAGALREGICTIRPQP